MERVVYLGEYALPVIEIHPNTLSYIVFRMAQSEPNSGVKGKVIYNKNLSN